MTAADNPNNGNRYDNSAAVVIPDFQSAMQSAAERIQEIKARLQKGGYASAHDYFADKDLLRRLTADLVGKRQTEVDPVGFWHGGQS